MNWFLAAVGLVGLYVILSWWGWANHTVAFHALGVNITVAILLGILGVFVILKATVFGK